MSLPSSNGHAAGHDTHDHVGANEMVLFWASFLTLIAAGIGFSVRGAILGNWATEFGFTQSELGTITGGGLAGFGVTIIVLSFFADKIGYGPLMGLAVTASTYVGRLTKPHGIGSFAAEATACAIPEYPPD